MYYKFGSLLRNLLNDLKRRPEDAAYDLGVSNEMITKYLNDELVFPAYLIEKACKVWPVSPRDFALVIDDTPNGLKLMKSFDSKQSSRVMERKGIPYYEYRDTAASSVSVFRPEWIKELLEVDNNDPKHHDVQWNNGHFMHQFTYFIGPVNFYYRGEDGQKKVEIMNTGDSMYISPFIPHTFATRKGDGGCGLILAITYGGSIHGDAQHELSAVGKDLVANYAIDYKDNIDSVCGLVQYYLTCLSMPLEELQKRTGIELSQLSDITQGNYKIDLLELKNIAKALGVNLRDLLTFDDFITDTVVVKDGDIKSWQLNTIGGCYKVTELASSRHMPMSKSLRLEINQLECMDYGLKIGLHQYLYNIGEVDIDINWRVGSKEFHVILEPNDSAFMKPYVEHCFSSENGQLLSLRIPSKINGDVLRELSYFGSGNVEKLVEGKQMWFEPRGRN